MLIRPFTWLNDNTAFSPGNNKRSSLALAAVLLVATLLPLLLGREYSPRIPPTLPKLPNLDNVPLAFEPNVGQSDPSARFIAHQQGNLLLFAPSEVVFSLERRNISTLERSDLQSKSSERSDLVRLQFIGANPDAGMESGAMLPGKVNYFIGKDSSNWHTNLETYSGITYGGLYPGIDLFYSGTVGSLKGTYTVAPGADPGLIRWRYEGAQSTSVNGDGNLQITLETLQDRGNLQTLTEQAPIAWQEKGGKRVVVSAGYGVLKDGSVAFVLGRYDRTLPLVIDPTLTYSTYLGGGGLDWASGIAVDDLGSAYVTGWTASTNFPLQSAYQPIYAGGTYDAFVTKLNATGTALVYSTFLGGGEGSSFNGDDQAQGIAVDGAGNAYIVGWTVSTDFPVVNPFQATLHGNDDFFVTKLNPAGSALAYSTYLGGQGSDEGFGIAVNGAGNAFVTGGSNSPDFPTNHPFQRNHRGLGQNAVLTEFTPDGALLVYSTYLGGTCGNISVCVGDISYGVALDSSGSAYITGYTDSTDFPVTAGAFQGSYQGGGDTFVSKVTPNSTALAYSTYFGGQLNDNVAGIAVMGDNAFVAGRTQSTTTFPTTAGALQTTNHGGFDCFITRLNSNGSGLAYSTFLGGAGNDFIGQNIPTISGGIKVDASGNAYVAGKTGSSDFPLQNPTQATFRGGTYDAFTTALNPMGTALVFSTYLGGTNQDWGNDIALDPVGNPYMTGWTLSTNFPTPSAFQRTNRGGQDGFVAKIAVSTQPIPTRTRTATGTPPTATPTVCIPQDDYIVKRFTSATMVPGTVDIGNHCDNCSTVITLPFAMKLYGFSSNTATLSSNGNIQFAGNDNGVYYDGCLPNPVVSYAILPQYTDLATDAQPGCSAFPGGCGIFTSTTGTAPNRIFNIEWRACMKDFLTFECTNTENFEARLYENSPTQQFDIVYERVDWEGAFSVVGVQESAGIPQNRETLYSCMVQHSIFQGLKLTFSRQDCGLPTVTPTGTPPTATPTGTPTFTNTPTATSDPCNNPAPWRTETPMTVPRTYLSGAVVNNRFYALGGRNLDLEPPYPDAVERFDPATNTWTSMAPIPIAAEHAGAAAIGNKIYVAGGYTVRDGFWLNNMQIYDTGTNTWSQGAPMPEALTGAGVAALNGKVYIIGGQDSGFGPRNTVYEYDPVSNTYATRAPLPLNAAFLGAIGLNNRVYAVGGETVYVHHNYDPATNTWSAFAPGLTTDFASPGVFALNGEIWVEGGQFGNNAYPPDQQVHIYSPGANNWRFGPQFNSPRYGSSAAGVINGRGYVVGGQDATTDAHLDSLESVGYLPCGTPTPTPVLLVGHVTWQGAPTQPNPAQQQPVTLTLKMGTTEVNYSAQNTDPSGFFTVTIPNGLPQGTYDWRAKGQRSLANCGTLQVEGYRLKVEGYKHSHVQPSTFNLQPSTTFAEMGLMSMGDANDDNVVEVTDFNILKAAFGASSDLRADFNNDGVVDVSDFNLLKGNFGQGGCGPLVET